MKCVYIELADDGKISVGLQPQAAAPAEGATTSPNPGTTPPTEGAMPGDAGEGAPTETAGADMRPARSIDDALNMAKELLEQPETTDGGPNPFEQGFAQARGQEL